VPTAAQDVGNVATSASLAYIVALPPGIPVPVVFPYNPESIVVHKQAAYHKTPQSTQSAPVGNFLGSHAESLTVTLILDMFGMPPIPPAASIALLKQALVASPVYKAMGNSKPPTVMFGWGTNIIMQEAVIKSMTVTYKRFLLGQPVRAEVNLTLEEVPLMLPGTNPSSMAIATRRTHTVLEGDSLASISFAEYGDPTKWRALAEANDIDDPMRLVPGTELLVPERNEVESLA
jgi:nucleoid-associated protein YgaU